MTEVAAEQQPLADANHTPDRATIDTPICQGTAYIDTEKSFKLIEGVDGRCPDNKTQSGTTRRCKAAHPDPRRRHVGNRLEHVLLYRGTNARYQQGEQQCEEQSGRTRGVIVIQDEPQHQARQTAQRYEQPRYTEPV